MPVTLVLELGLYGDLLPNNPQPCWGPSSPLPHHHLGAQSPLGYYQGQPLYPCCTLAWSHEVVRLHVCGMEGLKPMLHTGWLRPGARAATLLLCTHNTGLQAPQMICQCSCLQVGSTRSHCLLAQMTWRLSPAPGTVFAFLCYQ